MTATRDRDHGFQVTASPEFGVSALMDWVIWITTHVLLACPHHPHGSYHNTHLRSHNITPLSGHGKSKQGATANFQVHLA